MLPRLDLVCELKRVLGMRQVIEEEQRQCSPDVSEELSEAGAMRTSVRCDYTWQSVALGIHGERVIVVSRKSTHIAGTCVWTMLDVAHECAR